MDSLDLANAVAALSTIFVTYILLAVRLLAIPMFATGIVLTYMQRKEGRTNSKKAVQLQKLNTIRLLLIIIPLVYLGFITLGRLI